MLSLAKVKGDGSYYLDLAKEDYYLKGGEPPGKWLGEGARLLKLRGEVIREDFRALWSGRSRDGNPLVQNPDAPGRQRAWDLTFSAPKSVSVLFAMAPPSIRDGIQAAHAAAVGAALGYLEKEAGATRRGKAGKTLESAALVVAAFEHGTSRAQDPQLHTHALLLNVAVRPDGTTGTLHTKGIYEHKMAGGAIYQTELARGLEALGFRIEPTRVAFEVAGVPKSVTDAFSKRRAEIEASLSSQGLSSARAAEVAALATRKTKVAHLPRESLRETWQALGSSMGFGPDEARALITETPLRVIGLDARVKEALDQVGAFGPFPARKLVEEASRATLGTHVSAASLLKAIARALEKLPKRVTSRGKAWWNRTFILPALARAEKSFHRLGLELATAFARPLSVRRIEDTLSKAGYRGATLRDITADLSRPHPILTVPAFSTSGLHESLATILRDARLTPIFLTPSRAEKERIRKATQAPAFSLARATAEWKKARPRPFKPRGKGAFRPVHTDAVQDLLAVAFGAMSNSHRRFNAWQRARAPLDAGPRHAIVISNAHRFSTLDLAQVLAEARARAARVILVGKLDEDTAFSWLHEKTPKDGPRVLSRSPFALDPKRLVHEPTLGLLPA